jgi:hypothetical protein
MTEDVHDVGRWARGKPALLWKRPGLPRDWVRVLERHPEAVQGLPGYVWLDMPGKVRSVGEHELEFTHERERSAE